MPTTSAIVTPRITNHSSGRTLFALRPRRRYGRDYWRGDQERQDACDQRAQEREPQSQQPPGTEREHQHGQRSEHEDQW